MEKIKFTSEISAIIGQKIDLGNEQVYFSTAIIDASIWSLPLLFKFRFMCRDARKYYYRKIRGDV